MRSRDKKKILSKYLFCVYCGGVAAATTVDHIPSRGMFLKRDRPPGLIVPSCEPCNRNSSQLDDLVALFASLRFNPSESEKQHFIEKLKAAGNNMPDVLSELMPSNSQAQSAGLYVDELGRPLGAWNVRGPLVSNMILKFGAKCALALYYEEKGIALDKDSQIGVMWFSNAQALKAEIPQHFFKLLPDRNALGSGSKNSLGEFEYSSGSTTDGDATAHWATFGTSFMYYLATGSNLPSLQNFDSDQVFSPGLLTDKKMVF